MLIPLLVMSFPPVTLTLLKRVGIAPAGKIAASVLEVGLCATTLALSLPLAIALFPQMGEVESHYLEPEFQN